MPLDVQDYSVRGCFVPRPGYKFLDADIEALELCTLAQVEIWLLNDHRKADQINSGADLHCITGSVIDGTDYKTFFHKAKVLKEKDAGNKRNLAKVPGFGKPGGMADETLVSYARTSYGIKLGSTPDNPRPTREQANVVARMIGAAWRRANPNDQDYLDRMRQTRGQDGMYHVVIGHPSIGSVIRRGKASYCAACNSPFQGLGALASGEITWELQKACYWDAKSPLFGCRLVMFAYDEWLLECREHKLTEAGAELERIIRTAGLRKVPDVGFRAEAVAMAVWDKTAERVVSKGGELLVFGTPEADERMAEIKKERQAAAA
jgi:DNA polymerase-1